MYLNKRATDSTHDLHHFNLSHSILAFVPLPKGA